MHAVAAETAYASLGVRRTYEIGMRARVTAQTLLIDLLGRCGARVENLGLIPATFNVSRDGLVQGWVEALQMMREGDHWTIWVPGPLGYGVRGTPDGTIPPNQTLVFDLRLLSTSAPPRPGDPACGSDPDCAKAMQQQQGQ